MDQLQREMHEQIGMFDLDTKVNSDTATEVHCSARLQTAIHTVCLVADDLLRRGPFFPKQQEAIMFDIASGFFPCEPHPCAEAVRSFQTRCRDWTIRECPPWAQSRLYRSLTDAEYHEFLPRFASYVAYVEDLAKVVAEEVKRLAVVAQGEAHSVLMGARLGLFVADMHNVLYARFVPAVGDLERCDAAGLLIKSGTGRLTFDWCEALLNQILPKYERLLWLAPWMTFHRFPSDMNGTLQGSLRCAHMVTRPIPPKFKTLPSRFLLDEACMMNILSTCGDARLLVGMYHFLMGHMQWACHTLDVGSGGRRYSAAEVLESVQSTVFLLRYGLCALPCCAGPGDGVGDELRAVCGGFLRRIVGYGVLMVTRLLPRMESTMVAGVLRLLLTCGAHACAVSTLAAACLAQCLLEGRGFVLRTAVEHDMLLDVRSLLVRKKMMSLRIGDGMRTAVVDLVERHLALLTTTMIHDAHWTYDACFPRNANGTRTRVDIFTLSPSLPVDVTRDHVLETTVWTYFKATGDSSVYAALQRWPAAWLHPVRKADARWTCLRCAWITAVARSNFQS